MFLSILLKLVLCTCTSYPIITDGYGLVRYACSFMFFHCNAVLVLDKQVKKLKAQGVISVQKKFTS